MAEEMWYFADAGTQRGPLSWEQFRRLVNDGEIRSDTLVWQPGMANWSPAGTVTGLFSPWPASPPPFAPQPVIDGRLNYSSPLVEQQENLLPYAGFGLRFIAIIIDWIIVVFPLSFAGNILSMTPGYLPGGRGNIRSPFFYFDAGLTPLFLHAISWLYFALMESSKYQGTLGKLAMGIKVVDLRGGRVSFGRATGRYFAKFLSAMIMYIGFFMAAFTERKQGWHDMLANTLVVKK